MTATWAKTSMESPSCRIRALVHESRSLRPPGAQALAMHGADEPRSRDEIESAPELQDEVSSWQLGRVRPCSGRTWRHQFLDFRGRGRVLEASSNRRRGAQRKFSDHAIETALTLRLVFNLPLRQAEGFLRSVLSLMALDLEAPDHTTLARRGQHLNIQLARVCTKNPINLIVDSTGLSIVGEGEWADN